MNELILTFDKLYVLSGPSMSGKTAFLEQLKADGLPNDAVIDANEIRAALLGKSKKIDKTSKRTHLNAWNVGTTDVQEAIKAMLTVRMKQNLPTFVADLNLNDSERSVYVSVANEYGMKSQIIIFDSSVEESLSKASAADVRMDDDSIIKQFDRFSTKSSYDHVVFQNGMKAKLIPNLLTSCKIDVIGDVHGLMDETVSLLSELGWSLRDGAFFHSDPERKLLFLGDVVDRGSKSVELLETVIRSVRNGNVKMILGNHEDKLLWSLSHYEKTGTVRIKSMSSGETFMNLLALSEERVKHVYEFLRGLPTHYSLWIDKSSQNATIDPQLKNDSFKIAFGHADVDSYDPLCFPRSLALYGAKVKSGNADAEYQANYHAGLSEHVYFRGHVPNHSKCDAIFSLENLPAFSGSLSALRLDGYVSDLAANGWHSAHSLFEKNVFRFPSSFNYDDISKKKVALIKKLDELCQKGLLTDGLKRDEEGRKVLHPDGLKIFKYAKKVHFKKLWKTEPIFSKTRGLVLDAAHNVVVHPFDKIYNYGEYDSGASLSPDAVVHKIEKINGFLGCVSKHPFRNEPLLSTTGSLTSPFIQYIDDFMTEELKSKILKHFDSFGKKTLMFEVVHPEDPHIIKYSEHEQGLWLIGARGLELDSRLASEPELDEIAVELGVKRPQWSSMPFKDVLNELPFVKNEGFMIRDPETGETIVKIKSNYYLVTKFIGRMGEKMVDLMYKNPERFKENHVEEEFYPIVDEITSSISKDSFSSMEESERIDCVRSIIDSQRNASKNKLRTSSS